MKRIHVLGSILLVLCLLMTACGGSGSSSAAPAEGSTPPDETSAPAASGEASGSTAATGEDYTFAYITHTVTNQYWDTVVKGFEAQCAEEGVEAITYDSNADAGTQLTQIEDCISMGVDAILFSPLDDESAAAMVQMVNEAGIPIFIVDIGSKDDVNFVVVSDNYGAGRMLGEHAYEQFGDDMRPVVLATPPGFVIGEQRMAGYTDFFKEKGIEYDELVLKVGYDRDDVLKLMEDSITSVQDLNCAFAPNDDSAMGVIEALKAAELEGVNVYGFDATEEGLAAIETGTLTATIAQQPYLFGTETVKVALQEMRGESYEKNMDMPCALVTKENVSEYL